MSGEVFDRLARRYDAWFAEPSGAEIFRSEVQCVERLMPEDRAAWVEVGVGSGRFARALGIPEGVDPSEPLLEMAAGRGVRVVRAVAEALPYADDSLDGVLLVVTICFLDRPERAMREFARVLRPDGRLLVGFVPADSAWGQHYKRGARQGHPFYSVARFYTCEEVRRTAAAAGFRLVGAASTLPTGPEEAPARPTVLDGIDPDCGFVAMMFAAGREPL
jgi:ubiquinone/menaquinone biosynthesis C-methylase UbiE